MWKIMWLFVAFVGLIGVVTILGLLARGESETADPAGQAGLEEPVEPLPPGLPEDGDDNNASFSCTESTRVSWGDAEQNLNTKVALFGPVSEIRDGEDGAVVLEIGDVTESSDAEPVNVVLLPQVLGRLAGDPRALYADETICAVGVLQRAESAIRLHINEPAEILVL